MPWEFSLPRALHVKCQHDCPGAIRTANLFGFACRPRVAGRTASSIRVASEVNSSSVCVDKGFLAKPETYEQIYAYAGEMEWMEKPFHFVVSQWLDRRKAFAAVHGKKICISQGRAPICH